MRPATTYSPNAEMGVSTIGPGRLNCRVRNGNGCIPAGNITGLIRSSTTIIGGSLVGCPANMFWDTHRSGSMPGELALGRNFSKNNEGFHLRSKNMAKPLGRLVPLR